MAKYCNITTDLKRVVPDIEQYQQKEIIEDWTLVSGKSVTYYRGSVGYVQMVFESGIMYTLKTSIVEVEAATSSWWYDATVDILYIQTSGADIPTAYTIEAGEDWDDLLTDFRDEAMDDVDSYLSVMFRTPLAPRSIKTHTSLDFDSVINEATALFTGAKVIKRTDYAKGQELKDMVFNTDDELPKGILNEVLDGDRTLRDQITTKEVGSYNIRSFNASNSATIEPRLSGLYSGSAYEQWRLQIDTSGAPGTATWKLSDDGGASFEPTLQKTFDVNNADRRLLIRSGVYAYFPVTYASGDYWDIEVFPLSDTAVGGKISNITLTRC